MYMLRVMSSNWYRSTQILLYLFSQFIWDVSNFSMNASCAGMSQPIIHMWNKISYCYEILKHFLHLKSAQVSFQNETIRTGKLKNACTLSSVTLHYTAGMNSCDMFI